MKYRAKGPALRLTNFVRYPVFFFFFKKNHTTRWKPLKQNVCAHFLVFSSRGFEKRGKQNHFTARVQSVKSYRKINRL